MNELKNSEYKIGKVGQLLKHNIIHEADELYEFTNCYLNDSQWSYLYEKEMKNRIKQLYVLVIPIHTIQNTYDTCYTNNTNIQTVNFMVIHCHC